MEASEKAACCDGGDGSSRPWARLWQALVMANNRTLDQWLGHGLLVVKEDLLGRESGVRAVPVVWLILYLLAGVVTAWLCWKFYYSPVVWKRDLTDIGYNHVLDNEGIRRGRAGDKRRAHTINRLRRLRKVGQRIPPPFPNGWFGILESEQLATGQARAVDCLGQNFVVFRASDSGQVSVLDAYCPHLGANLGVGGIVRGDCIECPFHHWSFSGRDGQCVNIPYSKSGAVPKVAKVKKWTSMEANGFIFVWHHVDEGVEPWPMMVVPEVEDGRWVYYGKNEFLVNAHIQDIPENGADVAHLSAVHGPNCLSGSDIRYSRPAWAEFGMHAWHASWNAPSEENDDPPHIARMDLKHSFRFFNKLEVCTVNVKAYQIGPGYVQLAMQTGLGPMVALQTVTPVEPLVQKVIHRFYAPRTIGNAFFQKFAVWAESVMFERDMMIWNHKQFVDTPLLIKEDRLIKAYRKWYSQFYSENSTSYSVAKEGLDW